jgi:hypothetical protein
MDGIVTTNKSESTDSYKSGGKNYNRKTVVTTTTTNWQNAALQRKEVQ